MPTRPSSAGTKGGKKGGSAAGKKGKKKSAKAGAVDPHQEQLDALIREREEIRSKFNVVCSKIMENINMDDFQHDVDLSKQQPSDVSLDHLLSMVDQICYYRVAFLSLFQESDDNEKIPVAKKITQLAADEPDMFRKRLTADQRLTFVSRERDVWRENAQLLQVMYATVVDHLEMGMFNKVNEKTGEILQNHRLNLEDVCLIFSSSRIRSINDAQKLRAKKTLDDVLSGLREQHAFFDLDQSESQPAMSSGNSNHLATIEAPSKAHSSSRLGTNDRRHHRVASARRSVSFADEVNILNDDDEGDLQIRESSELSLAHSSNEQQDFGGHYSSSSSFVDPSLEHPSHQQQMQERYIDSDYYSLSSSSSSQQQYDQQTPAKSSLPPKYRLPAAREILVNKMDSNLRMLIIKELSKNGHTERPMSRMSSNYGAVTSASTASRRQRSRAGPSHESPEWVELARLIGIDESEIDHWLSQNLQYPAGRVISAWCNYASPPPTVAELYTLVSSKELNRPDLARYIETMYIIE